jgi:hypothetical protein
MLQSSVPLQDSIRACVPAFCFAEGHIDLCCAAALHWNEFISSWSCAVCGQLIRSISSFSKILNTATKRIYQLTFYDNQETALAVASLEARGDTLMALETGLAIVDVSVTHSPRDANRAAAARTDGAAAEQQDWEKRVGMSNSGIFL